MTRNGPIAAQNSSREDSVTAAMTPYQALLDRAQKTPDGIFLNQPVDGEIRTYSWRQCAEICGSLAAALTALGLQKGDRVAILAKNSAEWFLADWAIMMAGLVPVPVFPTYRAEMISYLLDHSEAKAIFVGKLDCWEEKQSALDGSIPSISMSYPTMDCTYQWQDLIDSEAPSGSYPSPKKDEVMTIVYTSGSTGIPKGLVISYGAYQYACETNCHLLGMQKKDRLISYLPLAHLTERVLIQGPAVFRGYECFFVESLSTFQRDLAYARPTAFLSVPRLWVKFQTGVHAKIPPATLNLLLSTPLLGKWVARKIRRQLGLDHCRLVGSGTAPISPLTLKWYERLGIEICEGWGMSETCGLSCGNIPFQSERLGTIGTPVSGTEMKLSQQGEILIRSPGLFSEYYRQPDLTRASFTRDGFLHTGDKAEWDKELGAYRITGRVKDLFKTAKGKYVAPVPIEARLSSNPLLEQICVMGVGLVQPVAVVVLSEVAQGMSRKEIRSDLSTTLDETNAALESHERLVAIVVAEQEWSIENELLTATMKIKRDQLEEKYSSTIDRSFSSSVVWE